MYNQRYNGSIPGRRKHFLPLHSVRTSYGAHPTAYLMGTLVLSQEVRQPGSEADHLSPPSVEVKNDSPIPPFPHTSSWRGA
jgi:hypothetical protein